MRKEKKKVGADEKELTGVNKFRLDVGKQIRILNTTQNWVVSKDFLSIAHQTWYMETMLQWTQNWSKIKTKLGQGKC